MWRKIFEGRTLQFWNCDIHAFWKSRFIFFRAFGKVQKRKTLGGSGVIKIVTSDKLSIFYFVMSTSFPVLCY